MFSRSGMPRACLVGAAIFFGLMLAVRAEDMPKDMHHDHEMQHDEKMQHGHEMMQHDEKMQHDHGSKPKDSAEKKKSSKDAHAGHEQMPSMNHGGHVAPAMTGMQDAHAGHDMSGHQMEMKGFLGPYSMTREGSGTSWLPDATPHEGIHTMFGDWMVMGHALINGVYDSQGGSRGGSKFFVPGMLMGMAERDFGDATLGFRAMLSPDPFMGANGYPLLLATGETADGRTPLVDRQHPHDLFMELATTYSYKLSANSSWFLYAGLPGEPALGPSAFMHRTSGMDIPEAPITHHWLDSTHISFGVVTAGLVFDKVKVEASVFRGREPNEHRYDIETGALDSYSGRVSYNPTRELSMQVSWGHIHSPEELMPNVNENRLTASATYTVPFGNDNIWSSTFAWGRKMLQPGETLDGFLLESELIFKNNWTLFMRAERVKENELLADIAIFPTPPVFYVSKISVGGIYDFPIAEHLKFGIGALMSRYGIPEVAKPFYGDPASYMIFFRLKVS
jgi:hypothetical protein